MPYRESIHIQQVVYAVLNRRRGRGPLSSGSTNLSRRYYDPCAGSTPKPRSRPDSIKAAISGPKDYPGRVRPSHGPVSPRRPPRPYLQASRGQNVLRTTTHRVGDDRGEVEPPLMHLRASRHATRRLLPGTPSKPALLEPPKLVGRRRTSSRHLASSPRTRSFHCSTAPPKRAATKSGG